MNTFYTNEKKVVYFFNWYLTHRPIEHSSQEMFNIRNYTEIRLFKHEQ